MKRSDLLCLDRFRRCRFRCWLGARPAPANIVVIYADDLGYGDVGYGATKVRRRTSTSWPRKDCASMDIRRLPLAPLSLFDADGRIRPAQEGTGVLPGDAKLIIQPGRVAPSVLKQAGRWDGRREVALGARRRRPIGTAIKPPLEWLRLRLYHAGHRRPGAVSIRKPPVVGLDPADPIQVSFATRVGSEPTGRNNPELLKVKPSHGHDQTIVNGISRIGAMSGGKAARWVDEDMADDFTRKATAFIERHKDQPFFLYFATHDIHVPRVPHQRFAGKTKLGPRGDVIVELDWCVGEITAALQRHGLADNTMVIFTSDNGPVVDDGYQDDAVEKLGGHKPAGPLRGGKYSLFEAGTRVPFIVRWPARIKPGVSDALVCQIDFLSSFAAFTEQTVPTDTAPDSFNVLAALLGQSRTGRDHLVEQANGTAMRQGPWKYIPPGKGQRVSANTKTETESILPANSTIWRGPGETRTSRESPNGKGSAGCKNLRWTSRPPNENSVPGRLASHDRLS